MSGLFLLFSLEGGSKIRQSFLKQCCLGVNQEIWLVVCVLCFSLMFLYFIPFPVNASPGRVLKIRERSSQMVWKQWSERQLKPRWLPFCMWSWLMTAADAVKHVSGISDCVHGLKWTSRCVIWLFWGHQWRGRTRTRPVSKQLHTFWTRVDIWWERGACCFFEKARDLSSFTPSISSLSVFMPVNLCEKLVAALFSLFNLWCPFQVHASVGCIYLAKLRWKPCSVSCVPTGTIRNLHAI